MFVRTRCYQITQRCDQQFVANAKCRIIHLREEALQYISDGNILDQLYILLGCGEEHNYYLEVDDEVCIDSLKDDHLQWQDGVVLGSREARNSYELMETVVSKSLINGERNLSLISLVMVLTLLLHHTQKILIEGKNETYVKQVLY